LARVDRLHVPIVLVAAAYVAVTLLLFAGRLREFADETDNLLGGLLIARGERLYVDYFSSHMPLAYYLAAIPAVLGASHLDQFRLFSNGLLIVATASIVWAFRQAVSPVLLGIWATVTVFAHNLQWGEMLTASTCAGFGVFVAGLLFYSTPRLDFSVARRVALSAAICLAIQSELVAVFPLLLLGVCYVVVTVARVLRERASLAAEVRSAAALGLMVIAPHAVLLLAFWLHGMLADFVYDAYQFNVDDYSRFVMSPTVTGMLHDWEAQYRTFLVSSLRDPLSVQGSLVIGNLLATWLVFRCRGLAVAVVYYLFVALCHVRNEGAYYVCSYFSLALVVWWASNHLHRRALSDRVVATAGAVVTGIFVLQVAATFDLSRAPVDSPEVRVVQALTGPGEKIFVLPYDPYVYLASSRMPASRLPFYFPWQAVEPRTRDVLMEDLRSEPPPVIIFRGDELVNGQWLPREYARDVRDFLLSWQYAVLDPTSPVVRDVLVRQDRLAWARDQLQARQLRP
jgi:hypothetical protein